MPTTINRTQVQKLLEAKAQLIEVLPPTVYEEEHLPGACNIPLPELDERALIELQPERPVIVYCHDALWDLSPRAAWRLETLGFSQVFDYGAGKVDWLASGLPTEGKESHGLRAKDGVRRNVPTCRLTDRLEDVRHRVQVARQEDCVVVNEASVVLGFVRGDALDAGPKVLVEQIMEPGPATIRPHVSLTKITGYMQERDIDKILVTTADGELVGLLHRQDAVQTRG
jgi:rhodanese-related sulfurtransferase/CBS domain-containing protein